MIDEVALIETTQRLYGSKYYGAQFRKTILTQSLITINKKIGSYRQLFGRSSNLTQLRA